jgi:hypothetical protein
VPLGLFARLVFLMGRCAAHLVMCFDCFGAAFLPAGGSKSPISRKFPSRTTLVVLPATDWAQLWLLVLQRGRLGLRNPVFLSPGRPPAGNWARLGPRWAPQGVGLHENPRRWAQRWCRDGPGAREYASGQPPSRQPRGVSLAGARKTRPKGSKHWTIFSPVVRD